MEFGDDFTEILKTYGRLPPELTLNMFMDKLDELDCKIEEAANLK